MVAVAVGRRMRSPWLVKSPSTVIAAIAPMAQTAAIPVMIFLRSANPGAVVG